jgi:N-dimethylarginine dimethylaminohydrolase
VTRDTDRTTDKDHQRLHSTHRVDEPFSEPAIMHAYWGERWGFANPTGRIRKLLVHRPGAEVNLIHDDAYAIEAGPVVLQHIRGYTGKHPRDPIDLARLQQQHDTLTAALRDEGAEVIELMPAGIEDNQPDRVFTRDLGAVIPGGIILSRFALYIRYGETPAAHHALGQLGMPVLGMVQGHGYMEGGSFTFVHERLALVGRSERVNDEGIEQLRSLLALQAIELDVVDLPASLIHLDEAFMMIDRDAALVDIGLLPYWLLEKLQRQGMRLFMVDPRDPPLTVNCLAVAPGRIVVPASGKHTAELLASNGFEVIPIDVSELVKLGGGIHCATLPLIRDHA